MMPLSRVRTGRTTPVFCPHIRGATRGMQRDPLTYPSPQDASASPEVGLIILPPYTKLPDLQRRDVLV